jgi:SRSO17 transposase
MKNRTPHSVSQSKRLASYLDGLNHTAGHADRVAPMQNYIRGLMLPIERKSVEPMAAQLAPGNVGRMHQSLHHFVAEACWSDASVLAAVRNKVLPVLTRRHRPAAWIVNELEFPKRGMHSVGVTRQRCDEICREENCRVAVSVSVATTVASFPVTYCLYLPKNWTEDRTRRQLTGVPEKLTFHTKFEIAIEQIRSLMKEQVPCAPVVANATYGHNDQFRARLEAMGLVYCMGVQPSALVRLPSFTASPPETRRRAGRPSKQARRDEQRPQLSVRDLASCLSEAELHRVSWHEGARVARYSRFARLRVHVAQTGNQQHCEQPAKKWLLIEWPTTAREPTQYWLSNLPESVSLQQLVSTAKMQGVVERDEKVLKQELGLSHYEGRNWRGFHHHATLCIAAYGFLLIERLLFSHAKGINA